MKVVEIRGDVLMNFLGDSEALPTRRLWIILRLKCTSNGNYKASLHALIGHMKNKRGASLIRYTVKDIKRYLYSLQRWGMIDIISFSPLEIHMTKKSMGIDDVKQKESIELYNKYADLLKRGNKQSTINKLVKILGKYSKSELSQCIVNYKKTKPSSTEQKFIKTPSNFFSNNFYKDYFDAVYNKDQNAKGKGGHEQQELLF